MKTGILIILFIGVHFTAQDEQSTESTASKTGRVVCYYESWSVYRFNEGKYTSNNVDPFLCTHLIYSFANVDDSELTLAAADEAQDITNHGFRDLTDLKDINKDLKVMLAVGGSSVGPAKFSKVSTQPERRRTFAANVVKFLREHNFDGLNVDWQWPGDTAIRGGTPDDYDNFIYLLQELNKVFREEQLKDGNTKLILSTTVPGDVSIIKRSFDLPRVHAAVEFINALCYDYHFAFEPFVNHHSPLYAMKNETDKRNQQLNGDATISYLLSEGVPPEKLNMGMPLYGRTYELEDDELIEPGSPSTGQGVRGAATKEDGYAAYFEICANLKSGWKVVHINKTAVGPYAYKANQWIGYDDADSSRLKGSYAKKRGLGGISFWAIDQDDFKPFCGNKTYPLIRAAKDGYEKATTETEQLRKPQGPKRAQAHH